MRTVARRGGTTCLQVDCNNRTGESGGQLRHGSPSLLFPLACQRLRGRFRARGTVGGYRIGAALCQPPRSDQFPLPLRGYEVLRVPLLPGTDSVTLFDMVNTVPAPYTNMHVVALRQCSACSWRRNPPCQRCRSRPCLALTTKHGGIPVAIGKESPVDLNLVKQ